MIFGILSAVVLTLLATDAYGQCLRTYTFCNRGDKSWQFNSQSTSGVLQLGEDEELSFMVYKGVDYRISFCSDSPEINGKVQFEIFEMETKAEYDPEKKRNVYTKVPVTIISNSELEMAQDFDFTSEKTRRLYVRVIVPEGSAAEGKGKKSLKVADYVCVGVLVQHQRGVSPGFN